MSFVKSITPNLIGQILRKPVIAIDDDAIVFTHKNGQIIRYPFVEFKAFARSSRSVLGGNIALRHGAKVIRLGLLDKLNVDAFVDAFNVLIQPYVENHLTSVQEEFNRLTLKHYPRDSWQQDIALLIGQVHENYSFAKELCHKYLSPELVKKLQSLNGFYPLDFASLRRLHEQYQLEKRQLFFDNVESNPLTEEQRLGVIRSNDRNMVLAAAGTGKTSVMVAKALDIIDRGLASPSEILVLAYNNAAAKELKERLNEKASNADIPLESAPHISTFHALGRHLLRDSGHTTHLSVFTEDSVKLKQWIYEWVLDYVGTDLTKIFDLIALHNPPVDTFDFTSKAEYEAYVRDNEFRTLNNELVKGYQELLIANFLFTNQIDYQYEAPYVCKRRIEVGFDYKPDFHILGTDIYIEHFGINRQGQTRPDIDDATYNDDMNKKRTLHQARETSLIETFHYEWQEDRLLTGLKQKLAAQGVECDPMPANEIFNKLKDQGQFASWSELLLKALQAIRVEQLDRGAIYQRLKQTGFKQADKFSLLLSALQEAYVAELKVQETIDFDDMIIQAVDVIHGGKFQPAWKYILVDEFQDISASRMALLNAIIERGPGPSLTVVGDDWQSIYRFSGGKLELTTRFDELVGPCSLTKLQKTFRYNNSIANTAGQFIMANPEQYEKHIETHAHVDKPQVYLLDDKRDLPNGLYERVFDVVSKIRNADPGASVAVMARYHYLLTAAQRLLWARGVKDNVDYWTFHKSKGLEADYCILIGFFQGKLGFPSESQDEAVIDALLPSLDSFRHSEERRLLYVGLTRAREKSYIIADPTSPSAFVTELLDPKFEINIASEAFQASFRESFKCPHYATGFYRKVRGQYGDFYACSTGRGCKVVKARACTNCGYPSIDKQNESVCNNSSCQHTFKTCEQCGRPMKKRLGKYGEFWGCTGYALSADPCDHTVKII
ncbi:helicase IV [Thalassotalea litorea]|uniref:Helicase IV n=1 Tax=Thalassotalea litorea TaxID=2020715 RepID=A0A5R9IC91_9GAMM|nr:UvrD-helicase domain-containing protein [Thalassotalea litorea]TLU61215.1 helicase IV [Thalassotalea litorea]